MQAIENIIKNLPSEDPSVIELERILLIKDLQLKKRVLKPGWLLGNQERASLLQAILVAPEVHYDKNLNKMGVDNLSSAPGASKVSANKDELISFINEVFEAHDIRPSTAHWVAEYKRVTWKQCV